MESILVTQITIVNASTFTRDEYEVIVVANDVTTTNAGGNGRSR